MVQIGTNNPVVQKLWSAFSNHPSVSPHADSAHNYLSLYYPDQLPYKTSSWVHHLVFSQHLKTSCSMFLIHSFDVSFLITILTLKIFFLTYATSVKSTYVVGFPSTCDGLQRHRWLEWKRFAKAEPSRQPCNPHQQYLIVTLIITKTIR